MGVLTPFFNLFKPAKTDPQRVSKLNDNFDIIDTEMHRPPLTVNDIEPDPDTRNIDINTVPLADNLSSDEAQMNTGTFIVRTSGGEASIADGSAWLSDIRGNQVKTGYVAESLILTVTPAERQEGEEAITATIDRDTFVEEVSTSGTITLTYTTAWSEDPATYGVTVTGTPVNGDVITIVYVKENRGTITVATPTSFVSTGWNLYNHTAGYARVVNYSNTYGFAISGTYTALKYAETLSGEQTTITPVDGYFTVPGDGYVFVTGGNDTDTEIWMTWSDWTEEANGGTFAAYSQTTIDLSGVMANFAAGLMRIGNYYDEINFNTQKAYSRIQRLEYTAENLANVIASGVPYDTDTDYIYAVRTEPVSYSFTLSGDYTVSDHGEELFLGTSVAVTATALYGNDLKGKLRRDVLTISQQTLSAAQKTQVLTNIGAANNNDVIHKTGDETMQGYKTFKGIPIFRNSSTNPVIRFQGANNATRSAFIQVNGAGTSNTEEYSNSFFEFREYSPSEDGTTLKTYYEAYTLPAVETDRTANGIFSILTQKNFCVNLGSIASSGTKTFNVSNNSRMIVFVFSGATARFSVQLVFAGSNGAIIMNDWLASTYVSYDGSTTGKLKITNSSGAAIYAYALVMAGKITE